MENSLKNQQEWNEDVTLTFGNSDVIRCKKCLLTQNSDYFKAMFSSGMLEAQSNTVEIKDIDIDVMRKLIKFMTSGESIVTNENVYSITAAVCRFQMTEMMEKCCNYLEKNLSHNNCFNILELANLYDLKRIFGLAKRHIQHYFSVICKMEEIQSLEVTTVKWLLKEKELNVESEMEVYNALERWIDSDLENRLHYLGELSEYIHYEDILSESDELTTLKYLHPSKDEILVRLQNKTSNSKFRQVPEVMLCVGLQYYDENTDSDMFDPKIYKFNKENMCFMLDETHCLTDMREVLPNVEGHGGISICINGKDLIVSGGEPVLGKNTWNLGVYCFDTFSQQWSQVTELPSQRRHHASCAVDNCLYMIGGFGRYRVRLNSVEKYSCDKDVWTVMAPSPLHGFHIPVTVLGKNIYAFSNDMVFSYCTVQDSWTDIQISGDIMDDTRFFVGAYTYNNKIYARGNNNQIYILKIGSKKTVEILSTIPTFINIKHTHGFQKCNNIMYCIHSKKEPKLSYIDLADSTAIGKVNNVMMNSNRKLTLSSECKLDLVTIPEYKLND